MTSLNRFRKPNSTQFLGHVRPALNYLFYPSIALDYVKIRRLTIKVVTPTVLDSVTPGGDGVHLITAYTGRLRPKGSLPRRRF